MPKWMINPFRDLSGSSERDFPHSNNRKASFVPPKDFILSFVCVQTKSFDCYWSATGLENPQTTPLRQVKPGDQNPKVLKFKASLFHSVYIFRLWHFSTYEGAQRTVNKHWRICDLCATRRESVRTAWSAVHWCPLLIKWVHRSFRFTHTLIWPTCPVVDSDKVSLSKIDIFRQNWLRTDKSARRIKTYCQPIILI